MKKFNIESDLRYHLTNNPPTERYLLSLACETYTAFIQQSLKL